MLSPDYSESQLQTAANLAYISELQRRHGKFHFPFVPSLPSEFLLGWDTAFELDWIMPSLPLHRLRRHKGCNFFLQYKLSDFVDSENRSKEWAAWKRPYFRFRIPHRKKNGNRYTNDFHQWDRLKEIAASGVPTFYATNTISTESELKSLFESGALLNRIALLDIAPIKRKHVHASFSDPFNNFILHSEPEKANLLTFSILLENLEDVASVTYEDGVEELTSIAQKLSYQDDSPNSQGIRAELNSFQERYISFIGRDGMPFFKRSILEAFLLRRFGIKVHWYPTKIDW